MRRTLAFIGVFALLMSMLALPATADTPTRTPSSPMSNGGVVPFILHPAGPGGNVSCDMLGYEYTSGRINYNGDFDGQFPEGIDVTTDGTFVAWTSTFGIGAVIVKGGNDANIYEYNPASFGDAGLASPPTSSDEPAGLSNLTFCFNDPPFAPQGAVTVEKTAVPSFTRTHLWDIDKKVETEEGAQLEDGTPKIWLVPEGTGDETATWTVDVTYEGFEDSGWRLAGEITATNTGNVGAQIRNWTDSQRPDARIINCRSDVAGEAIPSVFNYVIPVGESVTCDYLVDPADPEVTANTATVGGWFVLGGAVDDRGEAVGSFSEQDTATYDWDMPTTVINETVTIEDDSDLSDEVVVLGTVTAPDDEQFTYTEDFAWADFACGSYTYANTASIVETDQSASATLKVNVLCEELDVSKTADTSYTREHFWDIDKSVETEEGYELADTAKIWLYIDGSGDETAKWTVDVTYEGYEDSDFNVSGEITIENIGDLDAVITDVDDMLAGEAIDVDCGVEFSYTLEVGETLTCTYDEDVDSKVEGKNEVTITTERDDYSAEALIVWGDPTTEVNETVTIEDDSDLSEDVVTLGTVTAPNDHTFTYDEDFAYADFEKCGSFAYDNTATIVETNQSASATLKVNVQCFESAWAKGGDDVDEVLPFCDAGFNNWGWTNQIGPGTYKMALYAGAGQCDTDKGTLVGTVAVVYDDDGNVTADFVLDEGEVGSTAFYAGYVEFPTLRNGRRTTAPGQYANASPFDGSAIWTIAHANVPDPNFGPNG